MLGLPQGQVNTLTLALYPYRREAQARGRDPVNAQVAAFTPAELAGAEAKRKALVLEALERGVDVTPTTTR